MRVLMGTPRCYTLLINVVFRCYKERGICLRPTGHLTMFLSSIMSICDKSVAFHIIHCFSIHRHSSTKTPIRLSKCNAKIFYFMCRLITYSWKEKINTQVHYFELRRGKIFSLRSSIDVSAILSHVSKSGFSSGYFSIQFSVSSLS